MARAAAAGLLFSLGTVTAFAVVSSSSRAGDPTVSGATAATVYLTVTEPELYQGRRARWWAARAVHARREANARRIMLKGIRRSLRSQLQLGASGLERAFLCIHQFEGAWTDPDAPYYGGLQMDTNFMAAYGAPFFHAYGPSSNWTPAMQIVTAERAYLEGRGFGPWPATSRMCGLR